MKEKYTDSRTMVGVPFYDGEGVDVLEACLENIDKGLNNLGVDAEIIVGINGPRVSKGELPLSYQINKSKYNTDVTFKKTPPGLVNAERTLGRHASKSGFSRIFLTDADISRLPNSFKNLWEKGDKPVVGANYSTYPVEILVGSGIELSEQELAFMRIFEADKHPLAREFTFPHRPEKRLKGSLLLVDTKFITPMFGCQSITSDSRMNRLVSESDRQVVRDAAFMHFARVGITDHVQARLRHFRAAEANNDLEAFSRRSLIYRPQIAETIAEKIKTKYSEQIEVASDFLLQCALRHHVAEACKTVARRKNYEPQYESVSFDEVDTNPVSSFREAYERIKQYLCQVDWGSLTSTVTRGKGTTNNNQTRVPINLEPFLESTEHRKIIYDHLGLDEDSEI